MNSADALKIAAELVKTAIAAGWNSSTPGGATFGNAVVEAINTIADGLVAKSNK